MSDYQVYYWDGFGRRRTYLELEGGACRALDLSQAVSGAKLMVKNGAVRAEIHPVGVEPTTATRVRSFSRMQNGAVFEEKLSSK